MADNQSGTSSEQHIEVVRDLTRLQEWQKEADPMIKNHERILVSGNGPNEPSLVMLVHAINEKFDLILKLVPEAVKAIAKTISWALAVIIAVLTIGSLAMPPIMHQLHQHFPQYFPAVSSNRGVQSTQDASDSTIHTGP